MLECRDRDTALSSTGEPSNQGHLESESFISFLDSWTKVQRNLGKLLQLLPVEPRRSES